MSYYTEGKKIKESIKNKVVAIATHQVGAEIIIKALNYYFEQKTFTGNECVEMMHSNNSDTLKRIADFCEKHEYSGEMIIDYLREIAEETEAQALVVSIRDELKFTKPKD